MLDAITRWLDEKPRQTFDPLETKSAPARKMRSSAGLNETTIATLELLRTGASIDSIASKRGLSPNTIEGHLARAVTHGEKLDPRAFYSLEEEQEIQSAFDGQTEATLSPVFEKLGGRVSYGKLRIFLAFRTPETPAST